MAKLAKNVNGKATHYPSVQVTNYFVFSTYIILFLFCFFEVQVRHYLGSKICALELVKLILEFNN